MKAMVMVSILVGSIYYGFLLGKCYQHWETVVSHGKAVTINFLGEIK